MLSAEVQI